MHDDSRTRGVAEAVADGVDAARAARPERAGQKVTDRLPDLQSAPGDRSFSALVRRQSAILDQLDEVVLELDADCRVVAANRAACRAAGRPREQVLGLPCSDVLPRGEGCGARPGHACTARRARDLGRRIQATVHREAAGEGEVVAMVEAWPLPGQVPGTVLYRERAVGEAEHLEEQLESSLRSLESAHLELQEKTGQLESILRASADIRAARTVPELRRCVLRVLASVGGGIVLAAATHDAVADATVVDAAARSPTGHLVGLGRHAVFLDLLSAFSERRRVSESLVVEGHAVEVRSTGAGSAGFDLSDLFDGSPVVMTPLAGARRRHGFLLLKMAAGSPPRPADLHGVEILARLAASALDELERRRLEEDRARRSAIVARLGRELVSVTDPDRVLEVAARGLRELADGAAVEVARWPAPERPAEPGSFLSGPRILREPEAHPSSDFVTVRARLLLPVRDASGLRALLSATITRSGVVELLDESLLQAFSKVVSRAHSAALAAEQDQRSLRGLELVACIGRIAGASLEADAILARSLGELCQHRNFEMAAIGLLDDSAAKLVLRAQASRAGARLVDGLSTPVGIGVTGHVAATGRPVIVPDVRRESRYVAAEPSMRSELCVPLKALGEVIGVLDVESRLSGAFDRHDVVLLESVAGQLARSLHNARLYREVKDANMELRDSEQRKTAFLSMVAHDLRTPLTSIRSAADVVLMYGEEPSETREFLHAIRDESARLGRLVDDFLASARMEAGVLDFEVAPFDLAELLEHFSRVFEGTAARRGVSVLCDVADLLPPVLGDRQRVAQVVANLLSNATKFTPDGGSVSLTATPLPVRTGQVLGEIRVDVVDSGPGIEEHDREKVFERFVCLDSTSPVSRGAGLGLPIARSIVEHLGGRLWIGDAGRVGARFCFTLPALFRGAASRPPRAA